MLAGVVFCSLGLHALYFGERPGPSQDHQQALKEQQQALEEQRRQLKEQQQALEEQQGKLREQQQALEEQQGKLKEQQQQTVEEQQGKLMQQQQALEEQQRKLKEQEQPTSSPYQQGRADRLAWEDWVAKTEGDYRTGALIWADGRSNRLPPVCAVPGGKATDGCLAAKATLDPLDTRRNSESEYRGGWNSVNPGGSTPFDEGRAARQAWEGWFASTRGDYRVGALIWADGRNNEHPPDCAVLGGKKTDGCWAAKIRLDLSDKKMKSKQDHLLGWNSSPAS
jgi:hypothetical protein